MVKSRPSCHPERRYIARGMCGPCYWKDYYRRNRERRKAFQVPYSKAQYRKDPVAYRRYKWKHRGMDPDVAENILAQSYVCMICGANKRLIPDHNHHTGRVRGVLCTGCNTSLGRFGDNRAGLIKVLKYLEEDEQEESPAD